MYLKSIEMQGFKSFANKMTFSFQEGITAIVGPNGSGKSNVADAVRWVLGEQSAKQLRGGNMQDVIFAGTELRKPQSFAQVAITFDNKDKVLDVDYEEVTVTRRLYRSGESEYLINNTPVRLRDINEIFYDTGIGQEGYSIIGQGQIDRILSGKSEERRELFDEAAGIVKFKRRKKEALKKLEEEHRNLVRVNDILSELTSQLEPLRKQSETARKWLEKREALKELDACLFILETERTEKQLGEITGARDIADDEMAASREAFERTKAEYDAVEQEINEIDAEVSELTERSSKNAVMRQQLLGQIDLLREQIRALEQSEKQYEVRRGQIVSDIGAKEAEIERWEKEISATDAEQEEAERQEEKEADTLAALDVQIYETGEAIDQAKRDVIDMLEDRASVKGRMQRYDTMLEQMDIRRSEISGRLLRLKEEENAAAAESKRQEEALNTIRSRIEELTEEGRRCEEQLAAIRTDMGSLNDRLDAVTTSYHRDSSRLESLRAMAEHYDGYGNGIRRIMERKAGNAGIRGVVADLISTSKKYETAIETALGGSIRNIVTDNEATAKYLIEFLKAGKFGRATFLPMTSIKPRMLQERSVLKEEGVIGVGSELVECDDEYRPLAEHLLGRIVVVDNIDHAIVI
ncbi:MAG: chromosome segregation protein SMC, partial [Lachnospiraceae bacterium]|nr:chromosome segregation protein SMC [Lachnospiraceae bacterium]